MKPPGILSAILWLLLISLVLSQFSYLSSGQSGQEITIEEIIVSGECRDFEIRVAAGHAVPGCWDVKADIPGAVYHAAEDAWKSSFYYVERALCYPQNETIIAIRLDSGAPSIDAKIKLRSGSRILERDFNIRQICREPLPDYWAILTAAVIILIFGYSLTWWWKKK